jgi:hypothetical protein
VNWPGIDIRAVSNKTDVFAKLVLKLPGVDDHSLLPYTKLLLEASAPNGFSRSFNIFKEIKTILSRDEFIMKYAGIA